jgi:hypothetical protein
MMGRKKKETTWKVVREYKPDTPDRKPADCICKIIRRHLELKNNHDNSGTFWGD